MSPHPPTLLVLAAGMGSRYGGLKQLDPMGPDGQTVMDYSVHDALLAGFSRVVFVIRRDFEKDFRAQVGSRYERRAEISYAFQATDDLPAPFTPPAEREKPWGTGHAVWCARHLLDGPFAMINADDFYGRQAFADLAADLARPRAGTIPEYAMVAYQLGKTLSDHGSVSRGICQVDPAGFLIAVTEHTKIVPVADAAQDQADPEHPIPLALEAPVSMNLWGFTPDFLPLLEEQLISFLQARRAEPKSEFYVPSVVDSLVKSGQARVRVISTTSPWFGVTYPEDKPIVQRAISALEDSYP
jgi:choline kinase